MALELLLDEDTSSKTLLAMLVDAGHDVVTVADEGLQGTPDSQVLDRARELGRVLLTQNVGDFRELHGVDSEHPGILGIFHERQRSRDMTWGDVARAISNLEASEVQIEGEFHVLNVWR